MTSRSTARKIESEVDDSNQMILDFGDGFFGVAYSSLKKRLRQRQRLYVNDFRDRGKIQDGKIYGKNGVVTLFDPNKFDMERVRSTMGLPHLTDHQTTLGEPHIYEDINQLADWVLNGVEPYCTAEHARHVIEIIEAAYKSAEEGHVVTSSPP